MQKEDLNQSLGDQSMGFTFARRLLPRSTAKPVFGINSFISMVSFESGSDSIKMQFRRLNSLFTGRGQESLDMERLEAFFVVQRAPDWTEVHTFFQI